MSKPVVLIIRDGWGINPNGKARAEADGNVTLLAQTPFHNEMYARYPGAKLSASGLDVGLPEGQMGNSEVGHMNLGAGRIVYQDLTRINKTVAEGKLRENPVLQQAFAKAKGARLHFMGLVSDGGVHSHMEHLVALCNAAKEAGVEEIMVHAITDGRDCSPTGGAGYLKTLEQELRPSGAKIVTVVGRYYAMDRDQRWDRNKLAWDAIVLGRGTDSTLSPSETVSDLYANGQTDEFMPALIFSHHNEQRINDGDVVFFFNFRADRARQISLAFLNPEFNGFDREVTPKVNFVTLTQYDKTYGCPCAFGPQSMNHLLGEVVSHAGMKQLRIAETEKYPHVTYFFNGGIEAPFANEERIIVPSPKVATYDLQPRMSAREVTEKVLGELGKFDFVVLNFANPDMVGHTGFIEAGIQAVETIDACMREVITEILRLGGKALVTADHGNCEHMRNEDGSPNTAHTTNLVHLIYVAEDGAQYKLQDGILADVAPTLLNMMNLPIPAEMTGKNLLIRLQS